MAMKDYESNWPDHVPQEWVTEHEADFPMPACSVPVPVWLVQQVDIRQLECGWFCERPYDHDGFHHVTGRDGIQIDWSESESVSVELADRTGDEIIIEGSALQGLAVGLLITAVFWTMIGTTLWLVVR